MAGVFLTQPQFAQVPFDHRPLDGAETLKRLGQEIVAQPQAAQAHLTPWRYPELPWPTP